jgi:hypothetical protein
LLISGRWLDAVSCAGFGSRSASVEKEACDLEGRVIEENFGTGGFAFCSIAGSELEALLSVLPPLLRRFMDIPFTKLDFTITQLLPWRFRSIRNCQDVT